MHSSCSHQLALFTTPVNECERKSTHSPSLGITILVKAQRFNVNTASALFCGRIQRLKAFVCVGDARWGALKTLLWVIEEEKQHLSLFCLWPSVHPNPRGSGHKVLILLIPTRPIKNLDSIKLPSRVTKSWWSDPKPQPNPWSWPKYITLTHNPDRLHSQSLRFVV